MTDTEVAMTGNSGNAGGDTEIDLYADFAENELETVGKTFIVVDNIYIRSNLSSFHL